MNRIARPGIMREIDVRGPTVTTDTSAVARLEPGRVTAATVAALRTGAVLARAEAGVVALTGPGAVTCFQGLLTNDIEKPGDGAFVYGALLTPKGMIVVDGWATRHGTTVSYTVPAHGRERALEILTRSVPPRLARLADRTAELAVLRLTGPQALAVAEAAGLAVPSTAGRAAQAVTGDASADVARPGDVAPFALQFSLPADRADALRERLVAGGALWADSDALEFARILAGWAALGAGVDGKTVPQGGRHHGHGGARRGARRARRGAALRPAGQRARLNSLPQTKSPGTGPGIALADRRLTAASSWCAPAPASSSSWTSPSSCASRCLPSSCAWTCPTSSSGARCPASSCCCCRSARPWYRLRARRRRGPGRDASSVLLTSRVRDGCHAGRNLERRPGESRAPGGAA